MTATPAHFLANNWVVAHPAIVVTRAPGIRLHRALSNPSPRAVRLYPAPAVKVLGPAAPHHDDRADRPVANAAGSLGLMALVVLMAFLACGFRP